MLIAGVEKISESLRVVNVGCPAVRLALLLEVGAIRHLGPSEELVRLRAPGWSLTEHAALEWDGRLELRLPDEKAFDHDDAEGQRQNDEECSSSPGF